MRSTGYRTVYAVGRTWYKTSPRDELDLISGGRRTSETVNTGVPIICIWYVLYGLLLFLLLCASHAVYAVRRCVYIGHENVVLVRSPAVHQPHTYTVTSGTNSRA